VIPFEIRIANLIEMTVCSKEWIVSE
jgi:hypothetical protein